MLQARSRLQQEAIKTWETTPPRPQTGPAVHPRPRHRGRGKLLLVGLACLLLCLVVTAQYCRIVSLSFALSAQEERIAELREEYRELEAMSSRLASLSRIEEIARKELGMREPGQGQLKVLTAYLE